MNQYPTVFISFRQVDGLDFTGAYDMLTMVIADLYNKHLYLLDSKSATEFQKTAFEHLAHGNGSIKEVKSSLMLLTTMMQSYYAKPVILLIDEYDVPVAKANNNGYSSGRKRSGTRNGKIPGSSVVSAQTKHLYAGSTGQAEIERFRRFSD